jgi:hypothetical protein
MTTTSEEIGRAVAPLYVELISDLDLMPEEELAIRRAFSNAGIVGYRHGVADMAYSIKTAHPNIDLQVTIDGELTDPWGPAEDGELVSEWED